MSKFVLLLLAHHLMGVPLLDLLLCTGRSGLPPAPDTLQFGFSYHLHTSHRFPSTWGAVMLKRKKEGKNEKLKEREKERKKKRMKESQKIDDLPVLVTWWSDASAMLFSKVNGPVHGSTQ